MKKISVIIILTIINYLTLNGQSQIYSEDFTGQNGQGAYGPTPTTDVSSVTWNVDISSATLSASSDYIKVVNEILEARDLDGIAIWLSPTIDISGYSEVDFQLDASEVGTMEVSDIFVTEYRVNLGSWVQASSNGNLSDDFTSATVSETGISGNSLEIRVSMNNNSGSEKHRIDNIVVSGTDSSGPSPGITLGSVSGNTTEGGDSATFTVVLDAAPTNDVVLDVSSSDTTEVSVTTTSLTFSSSNWDQAQTVTLQGVDDSDADGDVTVTITVAVNDASSDDTYDGQSASTTLININDDAAAPGLIITEIADPNGSGSSNERFIEVFNNSNSTIDLTDYKIKKWVGSSSSTSSNESTLQGTLEAYSFYIIAADAATFKSTYGFAANQITSSVVSGNGDDSYALIYTSNGNIYDSYGTGDNTDGSDSSWEYEDGRAERASSSTNAETTFSSSNWNVYNDTGGEGSTNAPQTAPDDYDPGYWIGAPSYDTWNGLSSTDWETADNWASKSEPIATDNIFIREATNAPQTTSTAVEINDLSIQSSGSLSLDNSSSLLLTGDFTNSAGSLALNSDTSGHSSLTIAGTATGNITYNRHAAADRWYVISSPVSGQDIDTFISNEDLLVSTNNTSLVALADYNNDGTQYTTDPSITTGWWQYHQSAQSTSGNFTVGKGKIVRLASDATDNLLSFTGGINNGTLTVPITSNTTAFNLVGNPYAASIAVNSVADATNNVLTVNSALLSEQTAWFWDGSSSAYVAVNQNPSQAAKFAPPGQGFFISSATGGGDLSFTTAMQTSSQGSFNRQTEFSKIDLSMSADGQTSATEIVYFEGATTGWDNGYDSTNWSSGPFQIFTSHVDNYVNQNLAIQSLSRINFNNMVVPVGVYASAGQSIAISIGTTNWPEGVNVYLEDTDDNSFTLLDANTAFTTLLDSDENGIGRFYIHTTSNSLGDGDLTLTDVVIYTPSKDILRILGLSSGPANVQMFDLMGKQVLNTSFNGQSVNDVKLPNLNTGVYLVTLVSDEGTVNKKLIIQ